MAKIQTSVTVPTASWREARAKIVSKAAFLKAKVESDSEALLVLKRGSQTKMRLLGGSFIKDIDLPVKAEISPNPTNPSELTVTVSEHIVVGLTLGMRDKYQRACTNFAKEIVDLLN